MLDYRVYTFLSLCDTLNYTRTAALLQMTQPGVTQHIQLLEKEYRCKLFSRHGKTLCLTTDGQILQQHLRQLLAADSQKRLQIASPKSIPFRIGTTKTIGDYVVQGAICQLARDPGYQLSVTVENTDILLHRLDLFEIDLALIEGFFDRQRYACSLIRQERFTGLCHKNHPFAGKSVTLQQLFSQHILLREPGSGTRFIFENMLHTHNYTINSFARSTCINSFPLILSLIAQGVGISFAYESIAQNQPELATFTLQNQPMYGEFNFVYLKSFTGTPWFLDAFQGAMK